MAGLMCGRARLSFLFTKPPPYSTRHGSNWSGNPHFQLFFTPRPIRRFSLRKNAIWLIPLGTAAALCLLPNSKSPLAGAIASPRFIPLKHQCPQPVIISPAEPELSLRRKVVSLLKDNIWEPICTTGRFVHLFILFIPVILSSPMVFIGLPDKRNNGDRWGAIWWYDLLVRQMQSAGPTFIKLAQWAGSRADLFPSALCQRLGSLHSRGKPHRFSHTRKVIEDVFQLPFSEVFEEFEETPIGTGAIAQVYRGKLQHDLLPPAYLDRRQRKPSATTFSEPPPSAPTAAVAIKILHPNVSKMIQRDLAIMSFFARCISVFPGMQWLSLPEEVDVFGEMMFQQIDLRHEAVNLEHFEQNFAYRKLPVTFPRALTAWSTKEMLIEEFQNAIPLESFLKNGGGPYDKQVATVGLDAFLNMLLLDNFVHADLHPGNILIKFSKPVTTSFLLRSLYHQCYNHIFSSKSSLLPIEPDYSDSDEIVSSLRAVTHDPAAWISKLESISASGHIPEIVFIDAGLVTTLSSSNRRNFLDLFRSIAEFDGYRAGQLMISRSRTPELALDTETFALKMQHLILSIKRRTFSLGQIKINDVLTEVLRMVRVHHVRMEGDFINTVISALLLEGIGRQLDPNMDLFKSALPILRTVGGQMAVSEGVTSGSMSSSNLATLLKVWVLLEAREFITASIVNADDMIKYDWLAPSV